MARGTVLIERDRCKGCALCVAACPQHVLHLADGLNSRGYHPVELAEEGAHCTGCAVCGLVCPDLVFTVYREKVQRPERKPVPVPAAAPALSPELQGAAT